jgi:phosphoglycerol geranylgeranyltransferase
MSQTFNQLARIPKPAYFILIDPDKSGINEAIDLAKKAEKEGVDGILVGSSILLQENLDDCIKEMKRHIKVPLIIFPGILNTFSAHADAILFLSMISSRNPQLLIGEQVRAAPLIKKLSLEAISTAYILIESGKLTSVQFFSNSLPIPRDKIDIVAAHVLAAEFLGMKMIYLEAGSGAEEPVPPEMIREIKALSSLPVIVGGGIKNPQTASLLAQAGADFIVTGTVMEDNQNHRLLQAFAQEIHRWRK